MQAAAGSPWPFDSVACRHAGFAWCNGHKRHAKEGSVPQRRDTNPIRLPCFEGPFGEVSGLDLDVILGVARTVGATDDTVFSEHQIAVEVRRQAGEGQVVRGRTTQDEHGAAQRTEDSEHRVICGVHEKDVRGIVGVRDHHLLVIFVETQQPCSLVPERQRRKRQVPLGAVGPAALEFSALADEHESIHRGAKDAARQRMVPPQNQPVKRIS